VAGHFLQDCASNPTKGTSEVSTTSKDSSTHINEPSPFPLSLPDLSEIQNLPHSYCRLSSWPQFLSPPLYYWISQNLNLGHQIGIAISYVFSGFLRFLFWGFVLIYIFCSRFCRYIQMVYMYRRSCHQFFHSTTAAT